jgi:hypothetical protein
MTEHETTEGTPEGTHIESDFSLDDEFKPDPLAPTGNYFGHTVAVAFEQGNQAVAWKVTLNDNGGVMSDGETPIDGQSFYYRNWLPRPGDENLMTVSGRSTKRQAKINMMKQFATEMQVNMDTPAAIMEGIESGEWVDIPVLVGLGIDEYQGRSRNQISRMVRRAEGDAPVTDDEEIF